MDKSYNFKYGKIMLTYASFSRPPESVDNRQCHDNYELLYVLSGEGIYVIEGVEYPIKPGTMLFAPKLCYHSLKLNKEIPYERYVLTFDEADLTGEVRNSLFEMCRSVEESRAVCASDSISPSIVSSFEKFEYASGLPERERIEYAKLLTSEIVLITSVATKGSAPIDEDELGARVIKYLNEHINRDVSLDRLAKKFFVSKYYLCRAFKKHNGTSIHGYVNQKRVMYAKQLIEAGETASGAAYKVGFGDYSAFYRAYVKIVGKSPTSEKNAKESV